MKLITLIVVLLLERFWPVLSRLRADRAAEQALHRARLRLADGLGQTLATGLLWLGLPLLVLGVLNIAPQGLMGALIYTGASLGVLLLLLAPRQAHHKVETLQRACTEEDAAAAQAAWAALASRASMAAAFAEPEPAPLPTPTPTPTPNEPVETPAHAAPKNTPPARQTLAERIIILGFREWFAVLFWFVLAGPAGALFYRLTDWFAHPPHLNNSADHTADGSCPRLAQWQAVMDWPAARVYAALLLLAGGFNRGLTAWIEGSTGEPANLAQKNIALIQRVGHAALELEREDACAPAVCLADQSQWIKAAAAIVLRSLLLGLGLVALLTLSSWIR
ncbi:MAG: hypothetical protein B7Y58_09945 [Halothiobacillus sp. 35-54-62]|jgi:AmpE protein|nr:MAG: hypothetical protein B7Y58_09945 [Halothiobacillus sp. 35-54-62]OZA79186.1 MAG: hypothetical protein B7X64_10860 [Halothiobacillus sp. 39-53-45]HQS01739.1 hypothetical protein [Halothiobacillus sp.]HQS28315.1 hypothetical protein [Halothiobacillus sp.]